MITFSILDAIVIAGLGTLNQMPKTERTHKMKTEI